MTVSPSDIMHLCQEICDIKGGEHKTVEFPKINKLRQLSKQLSNTPDLDQGRRDKDGLDYVDRIQ